MSGRTNRRNTGTPELSSHWRMAGAVCQQVDRLAFEDAHAVEEVQRRMIAACRITPVRCSASDKPDIHSFFLRRRQLLNQIRSAQVLERT